MLTKDGDDDDIVVVVVVGVVSNRHKMGPAKALSKVIDTEVPPLVYPTKGVTMTCNRPEGLMVMDTECVERSEPLLLDTRNGTMGEPSLVITI